MSESASERSPRERQLDALIAEYYESVEQGQPVNQVEFTQRHPEFAAELRDFFADVGDLERAVPAVRPELEETQPADGVTTTRRNPGTKVHYLGDYEILEELGAGGMGVVYKARQTKLRKIVALKMIKVGQLASDEEVRRFQAEARAAAKLDHPGIVAVHEVGVDHRQHYYAMDFVGGGSLSTLHREAPVAARQAAELVKKLAEAMHYAHGQGIVHRDLKPANVLLTTEGSPRITDFGLAKRLWSDDDSAGLTMTETGQVLGTAGYMSPEQAAGKTRLVGPPADVYSLGAILYALLTSRAPFVGESQADTILQVIQKEPISPRTLNPSVPRDLETICLKCLEKEPHKRYGTAQLLADDLGRFLEGRPVLARPISRPARAWRWCRRNAIMSSLMATSALFLLVVVVLITVGYITQSRLAQELQAENARTNQNLYFVSVRGALQEVHNGEFTTARDLLERCSPSYRHWEWHWLMRLCDGYAKPLEIPDATVPLMSRTYSPDGRLLAVMVNGSLSGRDGPEAPVGRKNDGRELKLFSAQSGQEVGKYRGVALACSPDSRSVAIANRNGWIDLLDIASGERKQTYSFSPSASYGMGKKERLTIFSPCFSPDGRFLAVYEFGSKLTLWRGDSQEPFLSISLPQDEMKYFELTPYQGPGLEHWKSGSLLWLSGPFHPEQLFSPDGTTLAFPSASDPTVVSLWDLEKCSVARELKGHTAPVLLTQYNADGSLLASVDSNSVAKIWNPATGEAVFETQAAGGRLRFSPDGKWIVVSIVSKNFEENRVQLHNAADGIVRWKRDFIGAAVEFTRDSSALVVDEDQRLLHVINVSSGQDLLVLPRTSKSRFFPRLEAAPDTDEMAIIGEFGISVRTGLSRLVFGDLSWTVRPHKVSSDGKFIWLFPWKDSGVSTLQAWDFATERKLAHFESMESSHLLSSDGLECAVSQKDSTDIWKLDSGRTIRPEEAIRPLHTLAATGRPIAFSTMRRRLITEKVTQEGPSHSLLPTAKDVCVWSFEQPNPLLKFALRSTWKADGKGVACFIHPPDGPELELNPISMLSMSASDDARYLAALCGNDVQLWDCETARRKASLNHADTPTRITFAPQGTYVATARDALWDDKPGPIWVCLWNLTSGKLLHRFTRTEKIIQLEFSTTGDRLLCSGPQQIQLWSVPEGRLLFSYSGNVRGRWAVILAPDKKQVLIQREKNEDYRLIRVADGKSVTLPGSVDCWNFSFSPDSQRLVASHKDALWMFDTKTGTEVFRWSMPRDPNSGTTNFPRFSRDGSEIFVQNLRLDSGMRQAAAKEE